MTGTGTKTDPYIVDNWADFVQVAVTENAYVRFADGGGTIDMNDIYPEGINETVTVFANVDGNGWNIKNLHVNGVTAFKIYNVITSLNFIDFYITNTLGTSVQFEFYKSAINDTIKGLLYRCQLSGVISGASAYLFYGRNNDVSDIVLSRCGVKVQVSGSSYFTNGLRIPCSNCIFDIDASNNTNNVLSYFVFYNCLVKGKYQKLALLSYSKYLVLDAECQTQVYGGKAAKTQYFIGNKDKAEFDDSFYSVTTEQLKNAAYLASLGFPIGVD